MKTIYLVAGARPNFMKIAPIFHAFQERGIRPVLLHTGQHYDANMSDIFFEQLGLPSPDIHLGIGSGTHGAQTGKIMMAFDEVIRENRPDLVIVPGDVNSTIACALVAVKEGIPVAHVEAGLRSFDRDMPEEINRILTDQLCDFLLTPSLDGNENLANEGIEEERVFFVGNVMIDSLLRLLEATEDSTILTDHDLVAGEYGLLTLHRPSNVDDLETFERILGALETIQSDLPLVFPVHPRTRSRIEQFGLEERFAGMKNLLRVPPAGYFDFLALQRHAKLILTDSGGIQEEATYLKVPCITLRENTERPITIELGTNQLVGTDPDKILAAFDAAMKYDRSTATIPPLWDGKTAERIVALMLDKLS